MEFKVNDKTRISYYTSQKLGTENAFFTACGGFSERFGLNLAFGRGDSDEIVLKNLKLCADELNFDPESVVSCPQIHSATVLTVTEEHRGLGYYRNAEPADGYVTDCRNVVLGVKTADCTPIFLSAKRNGEVVAVGAVHAGWRGTVARISENAVNAMRELGVSPKEIFVAIGPAAAHCCYEVGGGVLLAAKNAIGPAAYRYIRQTDTGKLFADIRGINAYILHQCGVPYENMDISDVCTICEPRYFYSHRRDGENRGTHLNVIYF